MEEELGEELQREVWKQALVNSMIEVLQKENIEYDEEKARQKLSKLVDEL